MSYAKLPVYEPVDPQSYLRLLPGQPYTHICVCVSTSAPPLDYQIGYWKNCYFVLVNDPKYGHSVHLGSKGNLLLLEIL